MRIDMQAYSAYCDNRHQSTPKCNYDCWAGKATAFETFTIAGSCPIEGSVKIIALGTRPWKSDPYPAKAATGPDNPDLRVLTYVRRGSIGALGPDSCVYSVRRKRVRDVDVLREK